MVARRVGDVDQSRTQARRAPVTLGKELGSPASVRAAIKAIAAGSWQLAANTPSSARRAGIGKSSLVRRIKVGFFAPPPVSNTSRTPWRSPAAVRAIERAVTASTE